jgi:mono/diheme cytochrome c family protein
MRSRHHALRRTTGSSAMVCWFAVLAACSNNRAFNYVLDGDVGHTQSATKEPDAGDAPATVVVTMPPASAGTGGGPAPQKPPPPPDAPIAPCRTIESTEPVPARSAVTSADAEPAPRLIFTTDLISSFNTYCGDCHGRNPIGKFSVGSKGVVTTDSFIAQTGDWQAEIIDRTHSDDPTLVMPPYDRYRKLWSERTENDPIVELATMLDAWFTQGSPLDFFTLAEKPLASVSPYVLSETLGPQLTNIGNCVPDSRIVGRDSQPMDRLDAFFEQAQDLPATLQETDLSSFDSETLARSGVISFAPAYPLFSDGARKMRHVRVPRGKSITFDKAAQEFTIPPNTRFYKTFVRKVIEKDGTEHYRKMETRLIVSRPDGPDATDGSHETHALFGTYAWDENEVTARLVTDPLRNGKPFRDRLVTYFTDEQKAQAALDGPAIDRATALYEAHAARTYAIPGRDRCVQCHMGSHGHNFVLGFTPLQIKRRATGEGGTYEPASEDELGQLQRLIDYRVISEINSGDDILPLERSQGDRQPRNTYELAAQGYMLGNCGGCHNPRGYPTVKNPVLRDVLRFFPDRDGGIFQFPLDRTSPRIKAGFNQDIEIPYITPSLVEMAINDTSSNSVTVASQLDTTYYLAAPWRSLIYQNLKAIAGSVTPDNYVIYPHMPMNVPGFDTRAAQILGSWMVSIPAQLRTDLGADPPPDTASWWAKRPWAWELYTTKQPYVEVRPGEPNYNLALADAKQRLSLYRNGGRAQYDYFQDSAAKPPHAFTYFLGNEYNFAGFDKNDPPDITVHAGQQQLPLLADDPKFLELYPYGERGHKLQNLWIVTDITDLPPPWYPRRTDWATVLIEHDLTAEPAARVAAQKQVIDLLQSRTLTKEFRKFAVEDPIPFGLWQKKPECRFDAIPRVSDFSADASWTWMRKATSPDEPVYLQTVGGAVFGEICVNCHGPKFDSQGRLADSLLLSTGGNTRVANFRDGLFGPVEAPGEYRSNVFSPYASDAVTADDLAARYTVWMALGGTKSEISSAILTLVNNAPVLGVRRARGIGLTPLVDANMLQFAARWCQETAAISVSTMQHDNNDGTITVDEILPVMQLDTGTLDKDTYLEKQQIIEDNGDAELWRRLCAFQNPRPVIVLNHLAQAITDNRTLQVVGRYNPSTFPSNAIVGNHHDGLTRGLTPDNQFPWCLPAPKTDVEKARLADFVAMRGGRQLPICPEAWLANESNKWSNDDFTRWANNGAVNAGMAVFLYLDGLSRGAVQGKVALPAYDQCEACAERSDHCASALPQ